MPAPTDAYGWGDHQIVPQRSQTVPAAQFPGEALSVDFAPVGNTMRASQLHPAPYQSVQSAQSAAPATLQDSTVSGRPLLAQDEAAAESCYGTGPGNVDVFDFQVGGPTSQSSVAQTLNIGQGVYPFHEAYGAQHPGDTSLGQLPQWTFWTPSPSCPICGQRNPPGCYCSHL
jgi:hypothetical protein